MKRSLSHYSYNVCSPSFFPPQHPQLIIFSFFCYSPLVSPCLITHSLEAAREMELALHHVEEDRDGGLSQLDLRNQCHLQDRTHHLRNEFNLVLTLREGKNDTYT